ncbi:isoleucine--tRNA ligase [Pelodictyon phaeoclathratiforme]|jgi:isoleucyl-tRNA synthetase|uniref:Isoleucine--tRNA ligase n=1 Tax=Pelodictyon phaeoclathratiforme (strain DSM 5477 / BU-1) TaxID=324925 RepID=B4SE63_PELPB|nr:isoleucine--tRNA ligase [Pelodictyon phaeoclathratiforme]ACF44482.1 isoleucyl-tRNA synthetase [Pelodictyon phaeoclathratiforme BU-1]MBV5290431.1 isoleucine--tRNA ligase [Pelodictyon phaeoclathratiforme]
MDVKFVEYPSNVPYSTVEAEVLAYWNEHGIFHKCLEEKPGDRLYSFYEGPPTVNGKPGVHHVFSRTIKDVVCRYKTMQGYRVPRKAGWDTHGLPVEISVEKKLGLKNKAQVVAYGDGEFNAEAKALVYHHIDDNREGWGKLTERMGYWVDMEHPYITCTNDYIESVWWALKTIFDKGLIYKDYKIVPQDPKSETVLSSHELALGYKEVTDPSIYVKFRLRDSVDSLLVWTTTPWTLISNVALCVGSDIDYVKVSHRESGETLILAKSRLQVLLEKNDAGESLWTVVAELKGRDLEGLDYEPLFDYMHPEKKCWYVTSGSFVSTEDGTGIVHIAPAFGADDYEIAKKYDLPMLQPVGRNGCFTAEVSDYDGMFFKDTDPLVIRQLKDAGKLYRKEMITHTYPYSWRYDVPVIYYARESWYIRTTAIANRMVELNKTINWCPPEIGTGRFGNWLEDNKDWALSRERFWGSPLPLWVSEDFAIGDDAASGKMFAVGSVAELREGFIDIEDEQCRLGDALDRGAVELDLHKPFVDRIYFIRDGKRFNRTPELVDVWFDSGSMPFAQLHYPFEHREEFDASFPADFIAEGVDQTRGWFYTLHAIATLIFDKPAYKNLIVNGHILDKSGQKMSKSKGNVVDPFETMERYGADALRWYLLVASPPWRPKSFNSDEIEEEQRKFFRAFINSYNFFVLYANVDRFTFAEPIIPVQERSELDRWVLSCLNSLVDAVHMRMEQYDLTGAVRLINDFTVDDLSNWYIRRSRKRFWKSDMGPDKIAAYQTLYGVLETLSKLLAPFTPFLAERIFLNLNRVSGLDSAESVHLADFPLLDLSAIDRPLEQRMKKAQIITSLVRTMREKASIKVRQPLKRILLAVSDAAAREEYALVGAIIMEEVNVQKIEYIEEEGSVISKKVKPNFKTLGPRFGKEMKALAEAIRVMSHKQIAHLEKEGQLSLELDGRIFELLREDVEIMHEDIEGWLVASDEANGIMVALDTEMTEELEMQGLSRELVSRIQALRKESGLDITDRIALSLQGSEKVLDAVKGNEPYIKAETLATTLVVAAFDPFSLPQGKEEKVNGEICWLSLEKYDS